MFYVFLALVNSSKLIHLFAAFYNRRVWVAVRYILLVYANVLISHFKGLAVNFNPWHIVKEIFS
jgi:hypothetical protein